MKKKIVPPEIEDLVARRLDHVRRAIDARRAGDLEGAVGSARLGESTALMDSLREEIKAIKAYFAADIAEINQRQRWFQLGVPALALFTSFVACGYLGWRALARQRHENAAWARLRGVLANSPVGLSFLDSDLRFREINPAMALMGGQAPEDFIGSEIGAFEALASYGRLQEILLSVLEAGRVYPNLEVQGQDKSSGEPRIYQASFFHFARTVVRSRASAWFSTISPNATRPGRARARQGDRGAIEPGQEPVHRQYES